VGSATVSFTAPPDGGTPITDYTVSAEPGGAGASGGSSPLTVNGLTPGTAYTFTVTATNAAGRSLPSGSSNAVTPTAPAPVSGAGPGATPGPKTALRASGFEVSHKRFVVTKKKTALVARKRKTRTPKGTTFTFRLSEAALSRITIARLLPGRKKGKRCVAPRKRLKKRCTRSRKIGTLTRRKTTAGTNRVQFSGRLGKKTLRPGTYRGTLRAATADGRRSKPVSVKFRIVRR
jgi:hypothetical protein